MGTLNLSELQDEYLRSLGNRTDHTPALLTRRLNLAQERLARLHDFEEMQVTTSTTWAYTGTRLVDMFLPLPDVAPYIREIHSVRVDDGTRSKKLTRVMARTWDRTIGDPTINTPMNMPVFYTIWDFALGKAEGYPIPEKDYNVQWRLTRWPVPLVGAADKSVFRFKDELLIELAVIYSLDQLGKEDESVKHQKKFGSLFVEALNTNSENPDVQLPTGLERVGSQTMNPWNSNYWLDPFQKEMP